MDVIKPPNPRAAGDLYIADIEYILPAHPDLHLILWDEVAYLRIYPLDRGYPAYEKAVKLGGIYPAVVEAGAPTSEIEEVQGATDLMAGCIEVW